MLILGLTGSIGMGKSATARMFAAYGCPVHDADAVVHDLYESDAVPLIEAAFPGTTGPGGVDRGRLSDQVVGQPDHLKRLEQIVHPLVRNREIAFLKQSEAKGVRAAILEIPLLFETSADARCDAVIVCSAPADVQRARVLKRPEMTPDKLDGILARQMPDPEKRQRAHFVVDTSRGFDSAERQVAAILRAVSAMS
ncbi:MAG: dephospho-CoA kinase [Pseudomonadota bacterium]